MTTTAGETAVFALARARPMRCKCQCMTTSPPFRVALILVALFASGCAAAPEDSSEEAAQAALGGADGTVLGGFQIRDVDFPPDILETFESDWDAVTDVEVLHPRTGRRTPGARPATKPRSASLRRLFTRTMDIPGTPNVVECSFGISRLRFSLEKTEVQGLCVIEW